MKFRIESIRMTTSIILLVVIGSIMTEAWHTSMPSIRTRYCSTTKMSASDTPSNNNNGCSSSSTTTTKRDSTRRLLLGETLASLVVGVGITTTQFPSMAEAGIDVSGLTVEGGGTAGAVSSNSIRAQLQAYDGSGRTRVEEIKQQQQQNMVSTTTTTTTPKAASTTASTLKSSQLSDDAASFALRYGDYTRLTKVGFAGERLRYDDYVVAGTNNSNNNKVSISFEYPSDWLQLDKVGGGIQFVDQRNGDKVYVLQANFPLGGESSSSSSLNTVPKQFFGDIIFDPKGSVSKSGTTIEDYKVIRSEEITETSRKLTIKYATITGNGLRVERRALVNVQQCGSSSNVVYMLMTSSNAVKFEAKGKERDTVEAIVSSFRCDPV